MAQIVETPTKAFTAGAAIAQYLRVKLSSGKLAVAGVADGAVELGQIEEAAFADLDKRTVRLRSAGGTCKMVAAGAFSAGVAVNTAASGKIDDATPTGYSQVGIALQAATADGDIVEVLRI